MIHHFIVILITFSNSARQNLSYFDLSLDRRVDYSFDIILSSYDYNRRGCNITPSNFFPPRNMPALGIDLGTTNCCVAVDRGGRIEVVPFQNNSRTVPSYVSFWKDEILFGQHAKDRLPNNLENTVYDVKRIIGRKISDDVLKEHLKRWKFKVLNSAGKMVVKVKRGGETELFTPQELSGLLLKELKHKAEVSLGKEVTSAVITVPTYFTDAQRQATVEAGLIAGFRDVGLLTEPTAAAIAYNQQNTEKRRLIVFDFGGGTFDVSIVDCARETVTVLAIDGNLDLGGNDIDDRIVDHLIDKYKLSLTGKQLFRLRKMCEDAKKSFSDAEEALIDVSELAPDVVDEIVFARSEFNRLCSDIFEETKTIVERCMQAVKIKPADVDGILMIGGSSKIRCIVEMLEKHFGKTLKLDVNPDEAVAVGAAIYASSADPTSVFKNVQFTDISPYSLGVNVLNRPSYENDEVYKGDLMSVVIPRHTKIPTEVTKSYVTSYDDQRSIEVNIYSGENTYVKNNRWLGVLTISGLRIAPCGEVEVLDTFALDKNGILKVTVKDPEKNTTERLTLVLDKGGFSEDDLRGAIDVVQKRFNENLSVQDFKKRKTALAELCGKESLRKSNGDKCDEALAWLKDREYSRENLAELVEKLRELESL